MQFCTAMSEKKERWETNSCKTSFFSLQEGKVKFMGQDRDIPKMDAAAAKEGEDNERPSSPFSKDRLYDRPTADDHTIHIFLLVLRHSVRRHVPAHSPPTLEKQEQTLFKDLRL